MRKLITILILSLILSCNKNEKQGVAMKVQLFYFDDCPSYIETSVNLKKAMLELGIDTKLEMVEVTGSDDVVEKKFMGSPTIRINGVDLEKKESDYVFGCRVYFINGVLVGTPTKDFIRNKVKTFL